MTTKTISLTNQLVNASNGDTVSLPDITGLPLTFFGIVTVDSDAESITFTSQNGQNISGFPDTLVYKLTGFNVIYLTISRTLGWIVTPLAIDIVDLLASVDISLPLTIAQGGTASTYGAGLCGGPIPHTLTSNEVLTATSPSFNIGGSGAIACTLPLASSCPGKIFYFYAPGAGSVTINRAGSDTIPLIGSIGATSTLLLGSNNSVCGMISDGVSKWLPLMPNTALSAFLTGSLFYVSSGISLGISPVATGQALMSAGTSSPPAYTGSPSFSGSVTAATGHYFPTQTAPGNPATGWVIYTDTADGKLKAKNSAGTVRELALP